MKRSSRIITLAAVAASCLCGHLAHAGARPVIGGIYGIQLFDAKTAVGADGKYRLIFDYNPHKGFPDTYTGSALWIIDPNTYAVTAGSPTIPASVGATFLFPYERSNTAIFAQPSGNTTVLFYYGLQNSFPTTSFGTWTYNSSGNLIAASIHGPFSGTVISNLYFDTNGKIVVKWQAGTLAGAAFAGWVLDEFGNVVGFAPFAGPFTSGPSLGKIRVTSSNQQIWPWSFKQANGTYLTNIWTINPSGAITSAGSFGPF